VRLRDIGEILDAEVVVGEDRLEMEIEAGACADSMSDVLAFVESGSLLLTGLTNPHVVRTSHILDIAAIVIVRGKHPLPETIELAEELHIPILITRYILYEAVGRLYAKGLVGCVEKIAENRGYS
jgi:predicted transcriptional regulator